MEDFDPIKAWNEALNKATNEVPKPTDTPEETGLENANKLPKPISLAPVLARLPPHGQAWLKGLNPFCLWAVEHDLRAMPDSFVEYWESLRDTLEKLERELGPSDRWK
jgi:hypothetical protein